MGKSISPQTNQLIADDIIANAERMTICEGEPLTYAEATDLKATGKALARITLSGGDITKAAGDVSGDKFVVAAKSNESVEATGNADHVALVDDTNTRLLFVTTAATQALTQGNQVNVGQWQNETRDPT